MSIGEIIEAIYTGVLLSVLIAVALSGPRWIARVYKARVTITWRR